MIATPCLALDIGVMGEINKPEKLMKLDWLTSLNAIYSLWPEAEICMTRVKPLDRQWYISLLYIPQNVTFVGHSSTIVHRAFSRRSMKQTSNVEDT